MGGAKFIMSNTKKILQAVALAGAVTATGAVTTTAHADTTVPAASDQATTDAQSQLNNLKSQQQASEAAMAQNNQNQMSEATSAANAKIADLNNQMSDNNARQAAANSAALTSGTAQINAAAKSATDAENASYSQAVASQQAANAKALAEASKNIVTPAQKQAQTSAENANYQTAVNNAQAAHDQANAQLKADYDAANQKISDQIKNIQDKQSADQKQKLADATAKVDGQINAAAKAAQDANAKVSADQTAVKAAQDKANSAKTAYDNTVSQLNNAKENNKGNQQLSTDYPKLIAEEVGDGGYIVERSAEDYKYWKNYWKKAGYPYNDDWTDVDPVDQATKITVNADGTLTEESQNIANVFAANIINHMREQIGTPLVKVSTEGNAILRKLLALEDQIGQSSDGMHNVSAAQELMNQRIIYGYAENAATPDSNGNTGKLSVADLKNQIYSTMLRWINEEGNIGTINGHRYNILGVKYGALDNPTLALTIYVDGNAIYCVGMDFFNIPGTQHTISLANNGQSTTTPTVDLGALQQAVNTAKANLDQANSALTSAKSQLATDQTATKTANDKLNQLKANRDQDIKNLAGEAGSVADQVAALQKQATELANSYQAKVKAENDSYNQKLADLKAEHEKKLDAINKQPSDVNQLKAQLDQKLADLKVKHEANLKKINDDAQAKIDALKKQISDNDAAANKPILDQIAKIKSDLAAKQKSLDAELAALKANDEAEYNALHDKLFPKNTDVANGKSDTMKTSDGKVIVLPVSNTVSTIAAYPTREQYRASQKAQNLPQTGNNNSAAVIALGAISAMLGLGLAAKKREF